MSLSDADRRALYDRVHGRCECEMDHGTADAPHHGGRCNNVFTFASGSGVTDWWEPVTNAGAAETLENAQAFCGPCYRLAKV
jgi:hypothetical protein